MPAIYLTTDLMFSSRVVGAARQFGESIAVVGSTAALVERCGAETVPLVILDLSLPGLRPAELVAQLRSLPNPPGAIVAYAPHVHENLLAAAVEAGCTETLSRGQFNGQIDRILKQYCGRANPGG